MIRPGSVRTAKPITGGSTRSMPRRLHHHQGNVWSFMVEPIAYPVTTPIMATASSSSSISTEPEKTIDGSGLNANNQHSTDGTDMWLSNKSGPMPPWIQYEFDRLYKLRQMWVWNSNQMVEVDFGMGAKDVTIDTSTDGSTWTPWRACPSLPRPPVRRTMSTTPPWISAGYWPSMSG